MNPAVFLSYSRKDFPFERDIYRVLAAPGMEVWFNVLDMSAGENYLDAEHYKNFTACIRSRCSPNADIAIAHASNFIAHIGNIAHRIGKVALRHDTVSGRFDDEAGQRLNKPRVL